MSVIPVKQDKKPHIKWEQYQTQKADEQQIQAWWERWPNANVAIVTGKISGIDVVDVDSQDGHVALNEYLPDILQTPIVKTPSGGWHYYFAYKTGLVNATRLIKDCDVRTTGGYVVAPPSQNGNGQSWTWMEGFHIAKNKLTAMPGMLFDILQAGGTDTSSCEHIKKVSSLYKKNSSRYEGNKRTGNICQHPPTIANITFNKGGRDEALFHLSNHLVKGGMPYANIEKYLSFFASNCSPPFPEKEISTKISSAFKRAENRDRNLTQDIRDFIMTTSGNITTTFVYNCQHLVTLADKKKAQVILGRLVKEGILERTGRIAGEYRRIENDCEPENWQDACTDTVNLWLPFRLNEMIQIMPGSIILFAGSMDAGKSAAMMNIAKENMRDWNVYYFSSELNSGAFKSRVAKFPGISVDEWAVNFYQRSSNFHDVLRTGKDDLNLIDYLEIHDSFYKVSEYLARIHEKLGNGICIVALQKDPGSVYGRGGSFTQEKPILSVSLDHNKATISKFKGEFKGENPRGKEYRFKILNGCQITHVQDWCTSVKI